MFRFVQFAQRINGVGKHADVLFDTVSALLGQVQSGALKVLAVTGKDRFPAVPDVLAAIESGVLPGYDVTTWYGVFGPPGVLALIVAKLNKTLNEVVADAKVRERPPRSVSWLAAPRRPSLEPSWRTNKKWNTVREAAGIPQQVAALAWPLSNGSNKMDEKDLHDRGFEIARRNVRPRGCRKAHERVWRVWQAAATYHQCLCVGGGQIRQRPALPPATKSLVMVAMMAARSCQ